MVALLYKSAQGSGISPRLSKMVKKARIHPLLEFDHERDQPYTVQPGLIWDVNDRPTRAREAMVLKDRNRHSFMRLPAFDPRLTYMRITSTLFPSEFEWYVDVANDRGVDLGDILQSIYTFLRCRISPDEWQRTTPRHQDRVAKSFYARIDEEGDREVSRKERSRGVVRGDWLLSHTQFVGLAPSYEHPNVWNLITRREPKRR